MIEQVKHWVLQGVAFPEILTYPFGKYPKHCPFKYTNPVSQDRQDNPSPVQFVQFNVKPLHKRQR